MALHVLRRRASTSVDFRHARHTFESQVNGGLYEQYWTFGLYKIIVFAYAPNRLVSYPTRQKLGMHSSGRMLVAILKGKVAVVTGGGRGIGRAHALALAAEGAAVVVNDVGMESSGDGDRSTGPADLVVREIIAAGGRAIANAADISDWDATAGLIDEAVRAFGRLDVVVNNAGISRAVPIDRVSRRDWERTLAVNLIGTGAVCHWAAVHWRDKGAQAGRRLINTTSGMGLTPMPGEAHYSASKAGVAMLTVCCAMELAHLGVRANAVAPVARTRISEAVAPDLMKAPAQGFDRMLPEHAAALVVYLSSPQCRFTGRVFGVIGDDITLFDGWTVGGHVDNGESNWTVAGLAAALRDMPIQHTAQTQWLKGTVPYQTPAQASLDALLKIEGA
jgi:NAD(P)-dependent dehydrogenase (short-subunit alcohol dehydrogenase family)